MLDWPSKHDGRLHWIVHEQHARSFEYTGRRCYRGSWLDRLRFAGRVCAWHKSVRFLSNACRARGQHPAEKHHQRVDGQPSKCNLSKKHRHQHASDWPANIFVIVRCEQWQWRQSTAWAAWVAAAAAATATASSTVQQCDGSAAKENVNFCSPNWVARLIVFHFPFFSIFQFSVESLNHVTLFFIVPKEVLDLCCAVRKPHRR